MRLVEILLYVGPHHKAKDCKLMVYSVTYTYAYALNDLCSHFSSSCFIDDPAVFFGAFLGPIFAILFFNLVIFVLVTGVLIKHTRNKLERTNERINKKTAIRLVISIAGIMFLFGLTWLFGALTVTGLGDTTASTAFQILFVICNAFQGFFIFFFLCVFNNDARDLWLELLSCGRYQSKALHSSQAKYARSGGNAFLEKVKTTSSNLTTDQTDYLNSSVVKEKEQVLQTCSTSEKHASSNGEVNKNT